MLFHALAAALAEVQPLDPPPAVVDGPVVHGGSLAPSPVGSQRRRECRTLRPMAEAWDDPEWLRHVFEETRVVRRPLAGIIAGYHTLPYILVGAEREQPGRSVEVRGRIRVSPRMVITPGRDGPTYGELFGERELMHHTLLARVFTFRYAPRLMLESEDLQIRRQSRGPEDHLQRVLEELAQREIINTGVIITPDAHFYPVSIDRFIREILDQEFKD